MEISPASTKAGSAGPETGKKSAVRKPRQIRTNYRCSDQGLAGFACRKSTAPDSAERKNQTAQIRNVFLYPLNRESPSALAAFIREKVPTASNHAFCRSSRERGLVLIEPRYNNVRSSPTSKLVTRGRRPVSSPSGTSAEHLRFFCFQGLSVLRCRE